MHQSEIRAQRIAPNRRGTVRFLNPNEGVISDTEGYSYTFLIKDATADVKLGSPVCFRMLLAHERSLLGVATNVSVDPNPPAAPEYIITVAGCKNV